MKYENINYECQEAVNFSAIGDFQDFVSISFLHQLIGICYEYHMNN